MPSVIDIPQRFTTSDPVALQGELERFSVAVDVFLRQLDAFVFQMPVADIGTDGALAFGKAYRVPAVLTDTTRTVTLPTPAKEHIGKRCTVLRSSGTGSIVIVGVGATIGGASAYTMTVDVHFVEFLLGNDLNFYPSRTGAATP